MVPYNIVVTALDGSRPSAEALRTRLQRAWRRPPDLIVVTADPDELDEAYLSRTDACVVITAEPEKSGAVLPLLAVLEEAGVAALVMTAGDPVGEDESRSAGALRRSADCDDAVLTATLEGMLHRQQEVLRLRREAALTDRFQGGLQNEIARMHEELQLAAMVQREFLPRELPRLCGVEFAALWRPAHYVSGDIYDIARLDNDHVGVFIADAVGHGVPAALMTMIICRSLTTKIITGNTYELIEPHEVLSQLNQDLIRRQGRTTRFATAAYAVVNCRSRMMRFAGAGHPPPLLVSADGASRQLETEGGLLGVFDDEQYDQIELPLSVGDRLFLYSDGFEQAFPDTQGDAYRRRLPNMRYRREFEKLRNADSAQRVIETIGQRLNDQQGSLHQIDDLTLLCMRAGPLVSADEPADRSAGTVVRSLRLS